MSDLIQTFKGKALSLAEYLTPVLKESKFKETGVLTPDEFVVAGDHLVHQCPTWSWSSASEPSLRKPYLPADKQFLITKSVPCYKRCKDIEYCNNDEKVIMTENDDEGWVDTHHSEQIAVVNEMVDELTLSEQEEEAQQSNKGQYNANEEKQTNDGQEDDNDDDEAEDMDKFMNMVEEEDTSAAPSKPQQVIKDKTSLEGSSGYQAGDQMVDKNSCEVADNVVATRTYDLNITYDKYYQTPRLWLVGYDEKLKPLTINEMYQDISQDHAKKTVTMETHPHIPAVMASVHPCRHAEVMKKIISTVEDGGRELEVHSYLIVFLKLVQSVIPTLEYDFTQNFTM